MSTLYGTAASDNERTEHFVNNFYLGAYGRNATATELQQQRDALNAAAAQGLSQVQAQAETFGRSLFVAQVNDAGISNTQYVTNLYEAFLQVMLDSQNYYMIDVGSGSMLFRSMVNGVNDQTVISYDPTALPYWRIRHDQTANTSSFETSSNGVNWTTRKTVTAAFSLTAVRFYLMAGAWGTGNGSPGAAKYDNFQLAQSGAPPAPVTNLALNKPATQVSTYSTAVAGHAVDGNTDGSYYNNSVTHTAGGSQEWWQVDLGNSYALETIKVWNRTDCCSDRLSNFYVFVSDQPFSSYDLTTTLNQSGVWNFYTAGQGGSPTYINLNRTGRYVRVQLSTPSALSLAEVQVMGSTVALANINWLVTDQLGTPRMIFDKGGTLATTKRHDYLPFGEEIFAGTGGRTGAQGYGAADGVRQKFTQKERDNETVLDWFNSRYYSSILGRFTSPDSYGGGLVNPQTLNLYAYVRNNPLKFVDPTGHFADDPNRPHPNKPCSEESPCDPDENGVIKTNVDQKKDKPVGDVSYLVAERILRSLSRARQVSNQILLGPVGAKASDYAVHSLAITQRFTNDLFYGPELSDALDSLLSDPRVQLAVLFVPEVKADAFIEKEVLSFDLARTRAFENAGMLEASEVKFTQVDPLTGTVVEFKGPGGAEVGYDSPHLTPGPNHDVPHISWHSAGKRSRGGAGRGNIAYSGPQHPSRSPIKGQGVVDPH